MKRIPVLRTTVTISILVAGIVLGYSPIPHFISDVHGSRDAIPSTCGGLLNSSFNTVVFCYCLVEFLSLLLPRWRRLRTTVKGRVELERAVITVMALLTMVPAASVIIYSFSPSLPLSQNERVVFGCLKALPLMVPFLLFWLAKKIGRYTLGNGFCVLVVALGMVPFVEGLISLYNDWPGYMAAIAGVAALGAFFLCRTPTNDHQSRRVPVLQEPLSGLIPVAVIVACHAVLLNNAPRYADFSSTQPVALAVIHSVAAAILAIFLSWLFNRPSQVLRIWARVQTPCVQAISISSLARTVGFVVGVTWFCSFLKPHGVHDMLFVFIILAVVIDMVGEARAAHGLGKAETAWWIHEPYAVGAAMIALEREGITAFPRGLRYRALFNFFAPYVPVELLVQEKRVGEAYSILRALFLGGEAAPEQELSGYQESGTSTKCESKPVLANGT